MDCKRNEILPFVAAVAPHLAAGRLKRTEIFNVGSLF
jgi:hypothetical protein